MKSLSEFLQESLNSPYKWKITKEFSDLLEAEFITKNTTIVVKFDRDLDDSWDCIFSDINSSKPFDNTGHRESLPVLSTIVEILLHFLKKRRPDDVRFTGTKSDGKSKLYAIMLKKFSQDLKQLKYKIDTEDYGDDTEFLLTKINKDQNVSYYN